MWVSLYFLVFVGVVRVAGSRGSWGASSAGGRGEDRIGACHCSGGGPFGTCPQRHGHRDRRGQHVQRGLLTVSITKKVYKNTHHINLGSYFSCLSPCLRDDDCDGGVEVKCSSFFFSRSGGGRDKILRTREGFAIG